MCLYKFLIFLEFNIRIKIRKYYKYYSTLFKNTIDII